MSINLKDKVALVTGAGSGLGCASAIAFARAGAKVAVVDVDIQRGEEAVKEICRTGGEAVFIKADVAREDEVKKMVEEVLHRWGKLDFAHNNAGIMIGGLLVRTKESDWDRLMGVNLKGVWLCMKHEIIAMLERRSGVIVNTSSVTGLIGAPNMSLYATSKWGINGLTKSAAVEYASAGIRINAICPAGIEDTGLWKDSLKYEPELMQKLKQNVPMGRNATVEEIAQVVVWLCSDAASYITGLTLPVDGGMTAI